MGQKNIRTETSDKTVLREFDIADRKLRNVPKGMPSRELRRKIGKILWDKAGIIRDKTSLWSAIESIAEIRGNDLPGARSATAKEMLEKLELENALLVGEMISRSALLREETRGAHYRRDFPRVDDSKWKGNIFLKGSNTGMVLKYTPLS